MDIGPLKRWLCLWLFVQVAIRDQPLPFTTTSTTPFEDEAQGCRCFNQILVYCWSILQSLSWLLTSFSKSPEGGSKLLCGFCSKRRTSKICYSFSALGQKQVFRGKKYHFQLFWRNLIGALFKLIDPFPVKRHWHLHEIIYSIEDPIFPLIHCFVCVWKLSVAKMAKSTLGIMDVEHFAQNMQ